jgi:hypothetical protein
MDGVENLLQDFSDVPDGFILVVLTPTQFAEWCTFSPTELDEMRKQWWELKTKR